MELKHTRFREMPRKKGGTKKILQAYLAPGPKVTEHSNPDARCPLGPGMGFVPAGGRWCDMTPFLYRRLACGDLKNVKPPKAEKKPDKGGKE